MASESLLCPVLIMLLKVGSWAEAFGSWAEVFGSWAEVLGSSMLGVGEMESSVPGMNPFLGCSLGVFISSGQSLASF